MPANWDLPTQEPSLTRFHFAGCVAFAFLFVAVFTYYVPMWTRMETRLSSMSTRDEHDEALRAQLAHARATRWKGMFSAFVATVGLFLAVAIALDVPLMEFLQWQQRIRHDAWQWGRETLHVCWSWIATELIRLFWQSVDHLVVFLSSLLDYMEIEDTDLKGKCPVQGLDCIPGPEGPRKVVHSHALITTSLNAMSTYF